MAEAVRTFVARRKPEWTALEQLLERQRTCQLKLAELATLDRLYRHASADLAHAQTFYPQTELHRFLNQLTARAYGAIYRQRPARLAAAREFFSRGFPRAVRETLPYTALAAGLLLLGIVLGATTVALEPAGAKLLISEGLRGYLDRKELWTDSALGEHTPGEMATMIFTNNLRVTFTAFATGITAGLGTVVLLILNGLQNGALVAACVRAGLGEGIFSFMAAHGWMEVSIICITGGAGLMIGHALLEPGEQTRGEALRSSATTGVKLVLGCAPFLVGTGLVEGFVSPGRFFPWPVKVVLGLLLGATFWLYLLRRPAR